MNSVWNSHSLALGSRLVVGCEAEWGNSQVPPLGKAAGMLWPWLPSGAEGRVESDI